VQGVPLPRTRTISESHANRLQKAYRIVFGRLSGHGLDVSKGESHRREAVGKTPSPSSSTSPSATSGHDDIRGRSLLAIKSDREERWAFKAPLFDFRLRRGDKGTSTLSSPHFPVVVVPLVNFANLLLLQSRQTPTLVYHLSLLIFYHGQGSRRCSSSSHSYAT